jgi:hypothetical protein
MQATALGPCPILAEGRARPVGRWTSREGTTQSVVISAAQQARRVLLAFGLAEFAVRHCGRWPTLVCPVWWAGLGKRCRNR